LRRCGYLLLHTLMRKSISVPVLELFFMSAILRRKSIWNPSALQRKKKKKKKKRERERERERERGERGERRTEVKEREKKSPRIRSHRHTCIQTQQQPQHRATHRGMYTRQGVHIPTTCSTTIHVVSQRQDEAEHLAQELAVFQPVAGITHLVFGCQKLDENRQLIEMSR
jgi:hypothetical protein